MRALAFAGAMLLLSPTTALAQNKGDDGSKDSTADASGDSAKAAAKGKSKRKTKPKNQVFDFTGLSLSGSERMPQLLYFLERAQTELARASLERRSFIPEMVRSLDEGPL